MEYDETPYFEEIPEIDLDFAPDHSQAPSDQKEKETAMCCTTKEVYPLLGKHLKVLDFTNLDFGLYCCAVISYELGVLLDSGVYILKQPGWLYDFYESFSRNYMCPTIELCELEYSYGNIPDDLNDEIHSILYDFDVLVQDVMIDLTGSKPMCDVAYYFCSTLHEKYVHLYSLCGATGEYKNGRIEATNLDLQIHLLFPSIDVND
jgi:hypothetical protein